jgi:hypothetical protein
MKRIIAIASVLVAGVAAWLAWRYLWVVPVMETSPIVEASPSHAYQYIAAPNLSWDAARTAAANLSWRGHPGYLATIDDADEYQFILDRVFFHGYPDVTYLGGRQTAPGRWRWVTGPDAAADGGKGRLFWSGEEQGAVQDGTYANWMPTAFQHGGKWDVGKVCCVIIFSYSVPQFSTSLGNGNRRESVAGYMVEYGK